MIQTASELSPVDAEGNIPHWFRTRSTLDYLALARPRVCTGNIDPRVSVSNNVDQFSLARIRYRFDAKQVRL